MTQNTSTSLIQRQEKYSCVKSTYNFEKVFYDDTKETFEKIVNKDYSNVTGKFTKVIVVNKDNPYWFDAFLDKLHAILTSTLKCSR